MCLSEEAGVRDPSGGRQRDRQSRVGERGQRERRRREGVDRSRREEREGQTDRETKHTPN